MLSVAGTYSTATGGNDWYTIREVFRASREQDSGCVSYGVFAGGKRWFVKHSINRHRERDKLPV